MTVKELYAYILSKMSAEEAVMRLLEGPLGQYNKLKFDEGKEVHPLVIMSIAAMDMGWDFIIERNEPNIRGLVTGTEEYCKSISFKTNEK